MAALNDRAGVEMLQTYIGTALRSERLLCVLTPLSATTANLSTKYHNSISGLDYFTLAVCLSNLCLLYTNSL